MRRLKGVRNEVKLFRLTRRREGWVNYVVADGLSGK
jgi:hypothetical protein